MEHTISWKITMTKHMGIAMLKVSKTEYQDFQFVFKGFRLSLFVHFAISGP